MIRYSQKERNVLLFDPRSSEFRANPYPTYDYLRSHHPFYYRSDRKDWIVTRYSDVLTILSSHKFGRREKKADKTQPPLPHFLQARRNSQKLMKLWLLLLNPPDHTRIRRVLQSAFTPAKIQSLKAYIQSRVNSLITLATSSKEIDIVCDFAYPLTLEINCKILGIPYKHWHSKFSQWTRSLSLVADMDVAQISSEQGLLAISGLSEYFTSLLSRIHEERELQDGLLYTLACAVSEGKLNEDELLANAIFVFAVGHSSTEYLISNSVLTLLTHQTQLRKLQANPLLIGSAIDEVLRYESPAQGTTRTTLSDVEISGQIISRGTALHCILASANRDPAHFSNPDEFDIERQHNSHLTFSHGIHTCIGKHLAKLIAEIAVSRLVKQLPNMSLKTETLEWGKSFYGHGLVSLPVVF